MSDVTNPVPQDLKPYLLGQARADEAERLDELSITDDEFAEVLEAAEMDLIDSYVNRELSTAEREKFEQIYILSVDRSDRVAFANALQEYASSRISARPVTGTRGGLLGWTGQYFQFGLAAAVLLLAIVGGWFLISKSEQYVNETAAVPDNPVNLAVPTNTVENTKIELPSNDLEERESKKLKEKPEGLPTKERPSASSPRFVAVVLSPQLRSSGGLRKVEVPASTAQFSARLELESNDFQSYRAVLREQASNRVIWRSKDLKPTGPADTRQLAVSIPARLLNSAVYTFTVSGVEDNGTAEIVGDYPFKIVR
jgi:hypothetical protein